MVIVEFYFVGFCGLVDLWWLLFFCLLCFVLVCFMFECIALLLLSLLV